MTEERKAAFTPVDDQEVVDDVLTKAAAAAVADQEEPEITEDSDKLEVKPGEADELPGEKPETNDDELPTDHKERSNLGRKLSAFHRRQDETDQKLEKLIDILSAQNQKPEEEYEDDVPMTKAEAKVYFQKLAEDKEKQESSFRTKYQSDYDNTLIDLMSDYSEKESNSLMSELMTVTYDPTKDAEKDALKNFRKAERAFYRKQLANKVEKKDVPLKKDTPTGVITSQKTPQKEVADVKLSAAGNSYLAFIAKEDGPDKAKQLKKSL